MAALRDRAPEEVFHAARGIVNAIAPYAPPITLRHIEEALLEFSPAAVECISQAVASPRETWGGHAKFAMNVVRLLIGTNDEQFALVGIDSIGFMIEVNCALPQWTLVDSDRVWDQTLALNLMRAAYVELFRPGDYGRSYLTTQRLAPLVRAQVLLALLDGERRVAFLPDRFRRLEELASRLQEVIPALGDIFELTKVIDGAKAARGKRLTPQRDLDADDVLFISTLTPAARRRVVEVVMERRSYTIETAVAVAEEAMLPLTAGLL